MVYVYLRHVWHMCVLYGTYLYYHTLCICISVHTCIKHIHGRVWCVFCTYVCDVCLYLSVHVCDIYVFVMCGVFYVMWQCMVYMYLVTHVHMCVRLIPQYCLYH